MRNISNAEVQYAAGVSIEIFDSLPSTNDYLLSKDIQDPIVCVAKTQTAGKGRLGRHWHSPAGANLYFSLYWRFNRPIQALSGLSVAVGLVLLEALSRLQPLPSGVNIKWPNDLEYHGAKFAGVLIEIHRNKGVVIGVGLNLRLEEQLIGDRIVTDLLRIWGTLPSQDKILHTMLECLSESLPRFDQDGLTPFLAIWSKYKINNQNINDIGELIEPEC